MKWSFCHLDLCSSILKRHNLYSNNVKWTQLLWILMKNDLSLTRWSLNTIICKYYRVVFLNTSRGLFTWGLKLVQTFYRFQWLWVTMYPWPMTWKDSFPLNLLGVWSYLQTPLAPTRAAKLRSWPYTDLLLQFCVEGMRKSQTNGRHTHAVRGTEYPSHSEFRTDFSLGELGDKFTAWICEELTSWIRAWTGLTVGNL